MSLHPTYRPDIDGLRAVAIVPVILFHYGLSGFEGGYVGVDVFFVISGYLITSILHREMRMGVFSFAAFYERRIRRLLPAFAVVTGASFLAGCIWFLPADLEALSSSLVAAWFFAANLYFWKKTDYFDAEAIDKPLLHTWSLAVEEQFYIVFPCLLLAALRWFPGHLRTIIAGCALLSLLAAAAVVGHAPEAAFYLPHLRAWELLAGALLALRVIPPPQTAALRDALAIAGLALIGQAVFTFDETTLFPGLSAVIPVLGTAMVITAGSAGGARCNHVLGARPLVLTGLLSYSLYLWHWPLFVFAHYRLGRAPAGLELLWLAALTLVLAVLSWRYVERPLRGKSRRLTRRTLFRATALTVGLASLAGVGVRLTGGLPARLPAAVVATAATAEEPIPFREACSGLGLDAIRDGSLCTLGKNGAPGFLLWGDSHALSLAPAVDRAASQEGLGGRFAGKSACPPLLGTLEFKRSKTSCTGFNRAVLEYIDREPSLRQVFLVARWSYYLSIAQSDADRRRFADALEALVERLRARGIRVVVVEQVPEMSGDIPSLAARAAWFGWPPADDLPAAEYRRQQGALRAILGIAEATVEPSGFELLDPGHAFCDDDRCRALRAGKPLYRDAHHLSQEGASLLIPLFQHSLASDKGGT
ncbi:acyltransferase [Thauera aromatica]|uniref:acyltransferase family protein n=1 Tax=Thauera aromatica TaxID=59405 RepID=UPI001FFCD794|nr:acyltransferase family protein [Thauera aromatica]MCK2088235.1 acyltransferase [Thauera aromatica]